MEEEHPAQPGSGLGFPSVRLSDDCWWAQVSAIMEATGSYFTVLLLELTRHLSLAEITAQHHAGDRGECNVSVSACHLSATPGACSACGMERVFSVAVPGRKGRAHLLLVSSSALEEGVTALRQSAAVSLGTVSV